MVNLKLNNHLRIAIDGESSSGKSYASKIIGKKYKCFILNSGLAYRYASHLIIKNKPKKIIPFLKSKFRNLNYKKLYKINLHSEKISSHVASLATIKNVRNIKYGPKIIPVVSSSSRPDSSTYCPCVLPNLETII